MRLVLVGLFTPMSPTRQYYLAQILDLFAIRAQTFVQLILIKQGTARGPPSATWTQLHTAAKASLQECTFAETSQLSLKLLHPVSRASGRGGGEEAEGAGEVGEEAEGAGEVRFLSW